MCQAFTCATEIAVLQSIYYQCSQLFHSVLLIAFSCVHADLQPYLLFADGENGAIYRSNLDGSGIQQLVRGLPRPIALDFDYRYNANNQLNDLANFVYC